MDQPGRTWSATGKYRYGFNGKEKDSNGEWGSTSYDYGSRIYSPGIGRWFSVDPQKAKTSSWTPYRFGFNNPVQFRDPNGEWEEDGHFWTVYALGIVMGLDKQTAFSIAKAAEYFDHKVHGDKYYTMEITPHRTGISWGKDGGLGTWAEEEFQGDWHGLTGGDQKIVNFRALGQIFAGKLEYLHTLGDSWAHSYLDENGDRVMYGKTGRNEPWYSDLYRYVFREDITFEHAKAGPEHGKKADNISDRPYEYMMYINDVKNVFNRVKSLQIKNSNPDLSFFEFVQQNGQNKNDNIFLLRSFIGLKTGEKEFTYFGSHAIDLWKKYLDKNNIKYKSSDIYNGNYKGQKIIIE